MAVILKCPSCEDKFKWDFAAQSKWPKACPLCGVSMGEEVPDDEIRMPSLRSAKTAVIDNSYRQLEQSSETRMEKAAELAGTSVSDMSALKITDLKTNIVPGESYMPEVTNSVTQAMDQIKARGGQIGFTGAAGAEYSSGVQTGPLPNAGAKMRTALQSHHAGISHGSAVSDRPALETVQPGYRRRG